MKKVAQALISGLLGISAAQADQFHNINQIVGDRAIGLAGAYAAISDDPAGMVYNPAGIAFATSASLSANVNTFQYNQISYANALDGRWDFNRQSYQVLPNFFGVVQPFGKLKVGFYNAIVDSVQEKQDQIFTDFREAEVEQFVINLNNLATTYNVGPAAAVQLNDKLSVGLSLPMHYRSTEFIQNQHVVFTDSNSNDLVMLWSNNYYKTTEQGLRPMIGLSYAPIPKLSLGLSVDKTIVFVAKQTNQLSSCLTNKVDSGCGSFDYPKIIRSKEIPNYPIQIRVGGAWFPSSSFLMSVDLIHNSEVIQDDFAKRLATWDYSAGLEWYWSQNWAFRSGLFTSKANTPLLTKDGVFQPEHIDYYGGTLSVARFNKGSSISLGLLGRYGTGESQLTPDETGKGSIQSVTSFDVTAFFTTSYRY